MKRYGLIGKPLGHSFSARWFAAFFAGRGIDAQYDNFELESVGELAALIGDMPELKGVNVTSPYKQEVMPLLDSLTPAADAIGAVNCIRVEQTAEGVRLIGHNTDCYGFAAMLRGLDIADVRALVLGSGGASLAVRYALQMHKIRFTVVSHSGAPGAMPYGQIDADVMRSHRLIVNATPLGMSHTADECPPIPYSAVTGSHICLDLIYNPPVTEFMRRCAGQGAIVRNGLMMLIAQAEASYEFWTKR